MAGTAALGSNILPGSAAFADPLQTVSKDAAAAAKALAAGRSVGLRVLIPSGSQDNVRPVATSFQSQTGISVELAEVPLEDINTHLILASFGGGAPIDIALPATYGMPDLVDAGVLRSLSDFALTYEPAELRQGILYDVGDSFDDTLYGFQTDGDTYLMFYNERMLRDPEAQAQYADQTGRALDIPQTWDELDRQMAFFHRPDQGQFGGALFRRSGYLAWEWWVRFHAKGIWPFAKDLTPQIDGEEGNAALEELIAASQHLIPEADAYDIFQNWERFAQGNIYCNIGWGGTQKYLNGPNSAIRGQLAFGPTPGGIVKDQLLETPYFNWGWNYVVTQASTEAEISYLFCLFASSPDMSTEAVRAAGGFFDPFRAEHYADPVIRDVYSDAFLAVHRESLLSSIPDLYLASQIEYFTVLDNWLFAATRQDVSARDALHRVAQEWALITIRTGAEKQRERWNNLRALYPAKAQRLLSDL